MTSGNKGDDWHVVEPVQDNNSSGTSVVDINKDRALEQVRIDNQKLERKIARLEAANETLTESLQDVQTTKRELQDSVIRATTRYQAAEEHASTAQESIGRLAAENERLGANYFEQQAYVTSVHFELQSAQEDIAKYQQTVQMQQEELRATRVALDAAQELKIEQVVDPDSIAGLTDDIAVELLQSELEDTQKRMADMSRTADLLAEQNYALQETVTAFENGGAANTQLQRQYDDVKFKLDLNNLADDTKERHLRDALPIRIKAIFEEVAIPVFDVDFAAAVFSRDGEPIYSTSEFLAEFCVEDFLHDHKGIFNGKSELSSWFLLGGYQSGLEKTIKQLSRSAFPEEEALIDKNEIGAVVEAIEETTSKEQNDLTDRMADYLGSQMDFLRIPMHVEDRGATGFLVVGRKRNMPLSVADISGIQIGETISDEFSREHPMNTDKMAERWNTLAEQIDDMAAAYHDGLQIAEYARSFEARLERDPLLGDAASKGHRDALSKFSLENAYVVYLDDPTDRASFRVLKGGPTTSGQVLNSIDPERAMGSIEGLEAMLGDIGVGSYRVTDVMSGKTVVGRVVAFNEGRLVNYFERRVIDTYGVNLGNRITDYNEKLTAFRTSVDKETAQRLIAERKTFRQPQDHQRDQDLVYQPPNKQNVAILYADIKGFTAASQEIDSPDLVKIREILFTNTRSITDELKVMHDKLIGDCTLDLSGPPFFERTSYEDVATGVECLLRFNERVQELNEEVFQNPEHLEEILDDGNPRYHPNTVRYLMNNPVKLTTGMAYGKVIFGEIGTPQSPDFSVLGEAANLGSRIQGAAEAGEALVCSTSFRILTGYREKELPKYSDTPFGSLDGKYILTPMGEPKRFKNVKREQFVFRVDWSPDHQANHAKE